MKAIEHTADKMPAACVSKVSKSYGSGLNAVAALREVDLVVPRGEFTAIMGPSGSGKSTLMQIMAGLDVASSGTVHIGSTDLTGLCDRELTELRRSQVGFIFQAFNLVPTLDVRSNIRLPFELSGRRPNNVQEQWIEYLVAALGLHNRLNHRPHELSGGQQQRVAIVRALATRPEVVFADEPTGNLDARSGREVLAILRTASRDYRQSVVMVTHDPIAASFADRVVFLADGTVKAERARSQPEEISAQVLAMEREA